MHRLWIQKYKFNSTWTDRDGVARFFGVLVQSFNGGPLETPFRFQTENSGRFCDIYNSTRYRGPCALHSFIAAPFEFFLSVSIYKSRCVLAMQRIGRNKTFASVINDSQLSLDLAPYFFNILSIISPNGVFYSSRLCSARERSPKSLCSIQS